MTNKNNLPKVSIVGAGNVGSTCAFLLAANSVADVYLFDKIKNLALAKALDISQAAVALDSYSRVIAAQSVEELGDSHIVIITAGMPRKLGMSRRDLAITNAAIAREVASYIKEYAREAIVIVVSNPLDLMTWIVLKETGFSRRQVFGMAGLVDNSRLRYFTAQEMKISFKDVESHVLGLHSDEMVIPEEQIFVKNRLVSEELDSVAIKQIKEKTKIAGAQVIELLQNGSAYYLPGTAAFLMTKAVIEDAHQVFDASVYLEGEYGLAGVCLGVPVVLGKKGIVEIKEIKLSEESLKQLKDNARIFNEQLQML